MKNVKLKGVLYAKVIMEISKFLAIQTIQGTGGSVEHVRKPRKSQKFMKGRPQGPLE